MPLFIYCPDCGGKTDYTSTKPKCCSECGERFEKSTASISAPPVAPPKVKARARRPIIAEEDDDDDVDYVPQLSKLEVDIDVWREKGVSYDSLLKGAEAPILKEGESLRPPEHVALTKEKAIELLRKEGGNTRNYEAEEVI